MAFLEPFPNALIINALPLQEYFLLDNLKAGEV
jgi:hypothetical protein